MLAVVYFAIAVVLGYFLLGYLVTGLIAMGMADGLAIAIGIMFWILFALGGLIFGLKQKP